jgi:hypothetical protein
MMLAPQNMKENVMRYETKRRKHKKRRKTKIKKNSRRTKIGMRKIL